MFTKTTYHYVIHTKEALTKGSVKAISEWEARHVAAYHAVREKGRLLKCEPAATQVRFK